MEPAADTLIEDRRALLEALADVCTTDVAAGRMLDSLGFPVRMRPSFNTAVPLDVWAAVLGQMDNGVIEDPPPYRRLLDAALREYPYNRTFQRLARRYGVAAPPTQPAPGRRTVLRVATARRAVAGIAGVVVALGVAVAFYTVQASPGPPQQPSQPTAAPPGPTGTGTPTGTPPADDRHPEPFRIVYPERTLRVPRAWCNQVFIDVDTPSISSGGVRSAPELEYTDIECEIPSSAAKPPVLLAGESAVISEASGAAGPDKCQEALDERPGFTAGQAPRAGLRLCIRTDRDRVVDARVTRVDDDGTMYVRVAAWER
jgi:hypothetical protein